MNQNFNNQDFGNKLLLECNLIDPSPILRVAISEDSNVITDWLWFAEQVDNNAERRYCFERALHINPKSPAATKGIRDLIEQEVAAMKENDHSAANVARLLQDWMRTHVFRSTDADV